MTGTPEGTDWDAVRALFDLAMVEDMPHVDPALAGARVAELNDELIARLKERTRW